ncbi:MAG: hypothetical protein ABSB40_01510 [Nitrososphaeria archaeon]
MLGSNGDYFLNFMASGLRANFGIAPHSAYPICSSNIESHFMKVSMLDPAV